MTSQVMDPYAVLQVAPDAEREIIDAAYRQLMRKYHPDMARGDAALAARLHERAKAINQAYAILRDERQRQAFDRSRQRRPAPPPPRPPAPPPPPSAPRQEAPTNVEFETVDPRPWWLHEAPLGLLNSAYYLLPGPYEWEAASRRERMFTWLIPPLGVVAWLATTGRLSSLIGTSPYATLSIWLLMLLVLVMTDWRAMPRLAIAGASTLVLMSGVVDQHIREAGLPLWLAWLATGAVCLALAARPYIFGVLPTVAICGLLSRVL